MNIGNKNKNDNEKLKESLRFISLFAQKAKFAVGTVAFMEDTKNVLWEISKMENVIGGSDAIDNKLGDIKRDALTLFDYKRPSEKSINLSKSLLKSAKDMINSLSVLDSINSLSFSLVVENIMMRRDDGVKNNYEIRRRLNFFNDKSPDIEGKQELIVSCSDVLSEIKTFYAIKEGYKDSENYVNIGIKVGRDINNICSDLNDYKTRFLNGFSNNNPGFEKDLKVIEPAKKQSPELLGSNKSKLKSSINAKSTINKTELLLSQSFTDEALTM